MATFRADKVIITWNGKQVHGFAPGSFVTLERTTETFKLEKGADREAAWLMDLDDSGKCTFHLQQASASNLDLQATYDIDEATGGGLCQLEVADLNGATVANGTGRVVKPANAEFSNQFVPREWTIMLERLELHNAGITVR